MSTLPRSISGNEVSYSIVTSREPMSGVTADDVLARLAKSRSDAVLVVGTWAKGAITAISLASVPTAVLRGAVIETWQAGAVVSRSDATVAGRSVEILTLRDQSVVYVFSTGTIVYVVESQLPAEAEAAIALLPVG
jgi:hypothetical protein